MSSSPMPPDEFAALRRLLALKRHEQPPPGYFDRFAGRVIARIESRRLSPALAWWERTLEELAGRPAYAAATGVAAAALLIAAVGMGRGSSATAATEAAWAPLMAPELQASFGPRRAPAGDAAALTALEEAGLMNAAFSTSSVAPVLGVGSPFNRSGSPRIDAQPAAFTPGL